jgi:opine dehydrogenase
MSKKITVIGAGNGGHAMAFDLSSRGYKVLLYEHPEFIRNIEGIIEKGGIEAVETIAGKNDGPRPALAGFAEVTATADIRAAIDFSDTLFMIVPSFAQEILFSSIMPHLRDGQTLTILPGNLGSLVFKKMMREAGIRKKVLFAESNTIPYACRMTSPGHVFVLAIKRGMAIGALPGSKIDRVVGKLQEILNLSLFPQKNVIQVGLNNPNMVVHPPTAVLNMGIAESRQGAFFFYREGMSESVSKVQQKIDEERMAVTDGLNLGRETFCQHILKCYNLDVKTIREFAETSPIHSSFGYDGPKNPRDRYISEDCPFLLVPVHEFGKLQGIGTPAVESIITLASIFNDIDYFKAGRTLGKLGLAGMSKEQILDYVQ